MKKLTIFLALISASLLVQGQKAVGYNYRKLISVNSNQFTGTLSNYPVLVKLEDLDLAFGDGVTNINGFDIAFADLTGDLLPFELESYSPIGELVAWVNLPSITSGSTQFYLVYGNANVTTNQSTTGTWNTNYSRVYHMANDDNSTSAGGSATNTGTALVGALVGEGQEFNGSANWELGSITFPNQFTLSTWIYASGLSGQHGVFANEGFNSTGYGLYVESTGSEEYDLIFKSSYTFKSLKIHSTTTAVKSILGDTWHHVAVRINKTAGTVELFVDGSLATSGTINALTNLNGNQHLGALYDNTIPGATDFFQGLMDETRIETTGASNSWIRANYNNQRENSNFLIVTAEERIPYITTTNGTWATANWHQWGAPAPVPGTDADVTIAHNVSVTQQVSVFRATLNVSRTLIVQPLNSFTANLLINNGTIFLQANATGYGQLGPSSSISGTGTYTVEGHLAGTLANSNYRHLISPINTTLSQLADDFNLLTYANNNQGSVWYYDPNISKWQAPSGGGQSFSAQGFTIFTGTSNGTSYSALPLTFDVTGNNIRNGAQNFTLFYDNPIDPTPGAGSFGWYTANDGWNFAGNPYPSAIDWELAYNLAPGKPADMTPWVYVWDGLQNAYRAYNAITGASQNGGTKYIAPFQAVYLKMNSNASAGNNFTFVNGCRTVTNFPALARTTTALTAFEDELILDVQRTDNGSVTDNLTLAFMTSASDQYDYLYDGFKFHRDAEGSVNLYSVAQRDGQPVSLCYNTLGVDNSTEKTVDLGFENDANGAWFTLGINQFNSTMYDKVELEDLYTGVRYDLRQGRYSFAYDANAPKIRFRLHLQTKQMGSDELGADEPRVFAAHGTIKVQLPATAKNAQVELIDLSGRTLKKVSEEHVNYLETEAPSVSGMVLVRVLTDGRSTVHKVMIF